MALTVNLWSGLVSVFLLAGGVQTEVARIEPWTYCKNAYPTAIELKAFDPSHCSFYCYGILSNGKQFNDGNVVQPDWVPCRNEVAFIGEVCYRHYCMSKTDAEGCEMESKHSHNCRFSCYVAGFYRLEIPKPEGSTCRTDTDYPGKCGSTGCMED